MSNTTTLKSLDHHTPVRRADDNAMKFCLVFSLKGFARQIGENFESMFEEALDRGHMTVGVVGATYNTNPNNSIFGNMSVVLDGELVMIEDDLHMVRFTDSVERPIKFIAL